jgi:hypothetical protein
MFKGFAFCRRGVGGGVEFLRIYVVTSVTGFFATFSELSLAYKFEILDIFFTLLDHFLEYDFFVHVKEKLLG